MRADEALKELYDFALGEAGRIIREIGAETADCLGGKAAVNDDGTAFNVSVTDAEAIREEFGTEDTPPNPRLTQAIYNIKEKLKKL